MSVESYPRLKRWPFVLGDLLLVGTAVLLAILAFTGRVPMTPGLGLVMTLAVGLGSWLMAWPFLKDHDVATQVVLQQDWQGTLQQVRHLQEVGRQVGQAIHHAGVAQETLQTCFRTAESLAERMEAERQSLLQSLRQLSDKERDALSLELEKQKRIEQESLQVIVHLLDHTYALHQAGKRSGQPALVEQLGQFRAACLDAVRRLGLVAHEASEGEAFDPQIHRTPDEPQPFPGSQIAQTVACGYTYRGDGIRPVIVRVITQGPTVSAAEFGDPQGSPMWAQTAPEAEAHPPQFPDPNPGSPIHPPSQSSPFSDEDSPSKS